jgi:hypothetical protein
MRNWLFLNSARRPSRLVPPGPRRWALVGTLLLVLVLGSANCRSSQHLTSTTEYEATLVPAPQANDGSAGHRWGYIDTAGNWVIEPRFEAAGLFVDGPAPVKLDGRWGYIDCTGSVVIEPQFTEAHYFRDGLARVATGPLTEPGDHLHSASGYGFIDKSGTMVVPATWDDADDYHEGLAAVMRDSVCGFVDTHGELAIPLKFDVVGPFSEGLAQAQVDGKFGFIDTTGEWRIEPRYDSAIVAHGVLMNDLRVTLGGLFKDGLAPVYIEGSPAAGGTCQYIDKNGKRAFPATFQFGGDFNGGLAPVCVNDKWGFIDTSGTLVIEPRYGYPAGYLDQEFYLFPWNGFHYGLAPVALEGEVGYIDTQGKFVVPPQYSYGNGLIGGFSLVYEETPKVPVGVIDATGRLIYRVSTTSGPGSTTSP